MDTLCSITKAVNILGFTIGEFEIFKGNPKNHETCFGSDPTTPKAKMVGPVLGDMVSDHGAYLDYIEKIRNKVRQEGMKVTDKAAIVVPIQDSK